MDLRLGPHASKSADSPSHSDQLRRHKENHFGAPYLVYVYTLIVVVLPIAFDMSIVTITNIFQIITFFMNVTVVYAISCLPKRYPEAWAKNKFHLSNGGLYAFCAISIIIYTIIL